MTSTIRFEIDGRALFAIVLITTGLLACGDDAGTGGVGGEGGSSGGGNPSVGGSGSGGETQGGAGQGGNAQGGGGQGGAAQGSGGQGGGHATPHCADAVRCDGIQGYFCYEVTGPAPAFEAECTNELGGQFAQGPCGPEYKDGGCLFDCVEPSRYSIAIGIDQAQCETEGGIYVANP